MEKIYYIGLDVGSTTAKIAVIDSDNRVIYSKYERHNARVNELVSQYFDEILALTGDAEARICVTGSVGMATAEQLQAEFVQEVVAASDARRENGYSFSFVASGYGVEFSAFHVAFFFCPINR